MTNKKIAYLGPKDSYSFLAASEFSNDGDSLISLATFLDVLDYVRHNKADLAVVPLENSTEGLVNEVTDGLIFNNGQLDNLYNDEKSDNLYINYEFSLPINNFLIAKEKADFSKIDKVFTHWQPYGQCRNTLKKILPNAKIIFSDSTSSSIASIKNTAQAAIGGRQLVSDGFKSSDICINDAQDNCTRFAVLSKENITCAKNTKLTVCFEAHNKPGGLLENLEVFKNANLNMTRIESRPHKSKLGRYVFIVDILGNVLDDKTNKALEKLKKSVEFYKYLGGYVEIKH